MLLKDFLLNLLSNIDLILLLFTSLYKDTLFNLVFRLLIYLNKLLLDLLVSFIFGILYLESFEKTSDDWVPQAWVVYLDFLFCSEEIVGFRNLLLSDAVKYIESEKKFYLRKSLDLSVFLMRVNILKSSSLNYSLW